MSELPRAVRPPRPGAPGRPILWFVPVVDELGAPWSPGGAPQGKDPLTWSVVLDRVEVGKDMIVMRR
jgi:hypothetical protein